jgi:hypothetical protein
MSILTTAAEVARDCLEELNALGAPDRRNPHRYHEAKSDLAFKLKGLADVLSGNVAFPGRPSAPAPTSAEKRDADRRANRKVTGNVIHAVFGKSGKVLDTSPGGDVA